MWMLASYKAEVSTDGEAWLRGWAASPLRQIFLDAVRLLPENMDSYVARYEERLRARLDALQRGDRKHPTYKQPRKGGQAWYEDFGEPFKETWLAMAKNMRKRRRAA
jgi:hypothetical protein